MDSDTERCIVWFQKWTYLQIINMSAAQSAGIVEYNDFISAEA